MRGRNLKTKNVKQCKKAEGELLNNNDMNEERKQNMLT